MLTTPALTTGLLWDPNNKLRSLWEIQTPSYGPTTQATTNPYFSGWNQGAQTPNYGGHVFTGGPRPLFGRPTTMPAALENLLKNYSSIVGGTPAQSAAPTYSPQMQTIRNRNAQAGILFPDWFGANE